MLRRTNKAFVNIFDFGQRTPSFDSVFIIHLTFAHGGKAKTVTFQRATFLTTEFLLNFFFFLKVGRYGMKKLEKEL